MRFNSLQTGRYLQTLHQRHLPWQDHPVSIPFKREGTAKLNYNLNLYEPNPEFQFPSNGKIQPTSSPRSRNRKPNGCFNSLQTGRYIQTGQQLQSILCLRLRFNSLQTGRYIPTQNKKVERVRVVYSFNSLQTGRYIPTWTSSRALQTV